MALRAGQERWQSGDGRRDDRGLLQAALIEPRPLADGTVKKRGDTAAARSCGRGSQRYPAMSPDFFTVRLCGDELGLVAIRHLGDRDGGVVLRVAGLAELGHAKRDHLLHGVARRLQVAPPTGLLG